MIGAQRLVGASKVVLRAAARGRSSRGYYRRLGVVTALAALFAAVGVLMAVGPGVGRAAAPPTGEAGVAISTAPAGTVAGSVGAGAFHSCGVKTDGTLACWGDNSSGQLGAAPAAPSPDPPNGQVGSAYSHTFTSSTGSPQATFAVSAGELPPGLTLSPGGDLSGTPTEGGDYTFTVTASNGLFADASQQFTITIFSNTAPEATDDTYSTNEDAALTVAAQAGVLANDTDADGDPLTALKASDPTHGTLTLNSEGSFTYTPDANFNGTDTFTYTANDGEGGQDTATVQISVKAINDAPSFTKGADQTVAEDAPAQSVSGWATAISAGPSDESAQKVSFQVTNDNNSLFSVAPAISSEGTLTYTPAANANGSATVSVKATDDGGTANGGLDTSATQSFKITVVSVNDAPTIDVVGGSQSCLSNTRARTTLKLTDVETNATNLTLSATSENSSLLPDNNVTFAASTDTTRRTATITTLSGRTGISTVRITVSDGQASTTTTVSVRAGGNGRDSLSGTPEADILLGQNGDDTLMGLAKSDVLCGANGNDRLTGGLGADHFGGGSGTDTATDFTAIQGDTRFGIP